MNRTSYQILVSFLLSLLVLTIVALKLPLSNSQANVAAPRIGFVIASTRTFTPKDGKPLVEATIERFQRSDGSFKEVTTHLQSDGATRGVTTMYGQSGVGTFLLDEKQGQLSFIAPVEDATPEDAGAALRGNPKMMREDYVMGYRTIVLREPGGDNASYTEKYHAADLQGVVIKSVDVSDSGAEVTEPTKIEVTDPAPQLFMELFALPVSFKYYEDKIRTLEKHGHKEAAQAMREKLQRAQQAKH